jgi:hypothetical protein
MVISFLKRSQWLDEAAFKLINFNLLKQIKNILNNKEKHNFVLNLIAF